MSEKPIYLNDIACEVNCTTDRKLGTANMFHRTYSKKVRLELLSRNKFFHQEFNGLNQIID